MVLISVSEGIARITLNRPERHNSLVPPLLDALIAAIDEVELRTDVRAIVLAASGASFSTGGDVQGFLDNASCIKEYATNIVGRLNEAISRLIESPRPVIVAVDGQVTGGSLGLVLAGDIVVVTERASFTPWYSIVGFSPDGGWTALLPDLIGRSRAATILAANLTISAEQAMEWGMASHFASSATLAESLSEICDHVRAGNEASLSASKRLLVPPDFAERLEAERRAFVERIKSADALAGIEAFVSRGGRGK
ncbi:MAG: enoyl-CoA hydratase/isomerase family protein [Gammaproteobacteria bacterium]